MERGREKAGATAAGGNGSSAALAVVRQKGSALRWRFGQATSRLPFLFAKELIYDDRFFEASAARQEAMYERLVDVLYDLVRPRSVVDVGCGPGLMLARFAEKGVDVRGIEGSRAAIRRSRVGERITRANLERGVPPLGRFDLCLCIEVAEHLPERTARKLVTGLTSLSDTVVFTAATPGQGGRHHVNEQPHSYWRALFVGVGFVDSSLADDVRRRIAGIPEPVWMHANLMVFERDPRRAAT
jgi:SAM-dependent methyltransferase